MFQEAEKEAMTLFFNFLMKAIGENNSIIVGNHNFKYLEKEIT